MVVLEIAILISAILALGYSISSGFKNVWVILTPMLFWVAYMVPSTIGQWERTLIIDPLTTALLAPALLYSFIVAKEDPPDRMYFNLILISGIVLTPIVILQIANHGLIPDHLWAALVLLTSLGTWLCTRVLAANFRFWFSVTGSIFFLLWLCALAIHPMIFMDSLSIETLLRSLQLNARFFTVLVAFYIGGYSRLGLLKDEISHGKIILGYTTLMFLSWQARYPELEPLFRLFPYGDRIPIVASVSLIIYGPLTGVIFGIFSVLREKSHDAIADDHK